MQQEVQINQFTENFQSDVDKLWKSTSGTKAVDYALPSKIEEVCFYIDEDNIYNMKLQQEKIFIEYKIKNIDILETVGNRNEVCKKLVEGRINFELQKDYDNPLVKIILN